MLLRAAGQLAQFVAHQRQAGTREPRSDAAFQTGDGVDDPRRIQLAERGFVTTATFEPAPGTSAGPND